MFPGVAVAKVLNYRRWKREHNANFNDWLRTGLRVVFGARGRKIMLWFDHQADAVDCAVSCETVLHYEQANEVCRSPGVFSR
jgi:hypothetical protein